MQITITATVPDEWFDPLHSSAVLEKPHADMHDALLAVGLENVDIEGDASTVGDDA